VTELIPGSSTTLIVLAKKGFTLTGVLMGKDITMTKICANQKKGKEDLSLFTTL
jgi:hypothetical protein